MSGRLFVWERADDESPQAFAAFAVYRDLGSERSISAVVQKLNKSRQLIGNWSSRHQWVERVAAYDSSLDKAKVEGAHESVKSEAYRAHLERMIRNADRMERGAMLVFELTEKALKANLGLPGEAVTAAEAGGLLKIAATVSGMALDAEAAALGLTEKMSDDA